MEAFRKTTALLTALLLLLGLAACGSTDVDGPADPVLDDTVSGETLTAGETADRVFSLAIDMEKTLNPITTTSSLNMMVGDLVYDRLFEVDGNYNVTSRVLSDWYYTYNEDSNIGTWVLTVRSDIPMHDGSNLTAQDISYSLSRVFNSGAKHYISQMGRCYVSAYGNEVYITGDYAEGLLITRLAVPIIKGVENSIQANIPVGSGPYMYNEDATALEKFPQYELADELPLDTIYLRPYNGPEELITEYESSLVDLVLNDSTNIYNMGYGGKSETRSIPTGNMHFICFNSNSDFFRYEPYRNAMNYIINRAAVVEEVLDGSADPASLPIHPNSAQYDAEFAALYPFDPARARTELERGGCQDLDDDGMLEFAISGMKVDIVVNFLVCADNATKVQAARRIAEDMESIGIVVNMREMTWKEYIKALEYDPNDKDIKDEDRPTWVWDMYYGEIGIGGDWNTLTLFTGDWYEDGTLNYGRWDIEMLESAMFKFLGAPDETRPEAESDLLQQLAANTPFLTVCFERRDVLSHVGVITGMDPNQFNVFHNFTNWNIRLDG